jgi:hypothetical protein
MTLIPVCTLREPPEESTDVYPGLVVWDERCCGSITVSGSCLPLWCFIGRVVVEGHGATDKDYDNKISGYGMDAESLGVFLAHLLQMRGEFGLLLLTLADVERREEYPDVPWWEHPASRKRVAAILRKCLEVVED